MSGSTIVEIIVTFLFTASILFLVFKNMRLHFQNKDLISTIIQLHLDKTALSDRIKQIGKEQKSDTDGFIKFISQSRDEAYKYIEDSQKTISDASLYFEKNIDMLKSNEQKDIKYKIVIKELEKHFKKLKNLLPKEENDGR